MPSSADDMHLQIPGNLYGMQRTDSVTSLSYRKQKDGSLLSICLNTSMLLPLLDRELYDACASKDVEAVRRLLRTNAYVNDIGLKKHISNESADHIPYMKEYYSLVDYLFNDSEIENHESLLSLVTESLTGISVTYEYALCSLLVQSVKKEYSNILAILMKYKQYFDIDAKDFTGNTALHYAVLKEGDFHHNLVKTLIMNGASMNVKNSEGIRAIDKIHPNTIEDILNECMEEANTSNDRRNEDYELKMNFRIFSHKESSINKSESEFIEALENSKPHQHFLRHPLVASFLHIKWQKIKVIWYLSIVYNITFYLLIFLYMCLDWSLSPAPINGKTNPDEEPNLIVLKIVITFLGSIQMAREIAQMKMFKWNYFLSFDNQLELLILILTGIMIYIKGYSSHYHTSISAWLVVFITVEFLLIVEKMHLLKISIFISMFRKITYNFVKLTLILFSMVMAFGMSFYLLIHVKQEDTEEDNNQTSISNNQTSQKEEKEPIKFADNFVKGILKTLVMATGEFDYGSLDFKTFPASSLLFAMFIFAIFLVAMNLLNGIAITDIQEIQNGANNYHVRDQVECVINFDNIRPMYSWLLNFSCLRGLDIGKFGPVFRKCFPDKSITLMPNKYDSISSVICKGHDHFYYTNKFHFHFMRLFDLISCGTCGDLTNLCQGCIQNIPQDKHECIYKHHYIIPANLISDAKEIKERSDDDEETSRKEEDRSRMINMEKLIIEMQKQIDNLNGEYMRESTC